jgi:hypothetical protein
MDFKNKTSLVLERETLNLIVTESKRLVVLMQSRQKDQDSFRCRRGKY